MAGVASVPGLTVEDIRRFTVDEFDRMVELGILTDEERVELLESVLVPMMPIGDLHAGCVNRLNDLLSRRLGERALVIVQNPIALPTSRPYPDIAVLRRRADYYATGKPGPTDSYLVVEVADTSLDRDRGLKLPAYGRAGIGESWVVDLVGQAVIAGREPSPMGYASVSTHHRGERLTVPGFPDVVLTVDEILGPSSV